MNRKPSRVERKDVTICQSVNNEDNMNGRIIPSIFTVKDMNVTAKRHSKIPFCQFLLFALDQPCLNFFI